MPAPSKAPSRLRLSDWQGRPLSMPDDEGAWETLGRGKHILLLGLGPTRPWELSFVREATAAGSRIFWLDAPQTLQGLLQARPEYLRQMPSDWRQVSLEAARELAGGCRIYFYCPGLRLAPDFWGPLLGHLEAHALLPASRSPAKGTGTVLLPGHAGQLLHQELRQALLQNGFAAVCERLPPATGLKNMKDWQAICEKQIPSLLLSVNMRGLDSEGRIFRLCSALGTSVAIWFVDNPWHILSRIRLPWWQEASLFVTDASFMPELQKAGAKKVFHLPLAVAPHMWQPLPDKEEAALSRQGPALFVGRSSFPERERFFAAVHLPPHLIAKADPLLAETNGPADGPHFFWWQQQLGLCPWPGQAIRSAGLGAEECSRRRRSHWLQVGLRYGLHIVGDAGWKRCLPEAEILPPVDYYGSLPSLYARAGAILNVTSLLLPHSLSQRHFDVWAAGGLLLSDTTPGLDIFPEELTAPILCRTADDFPRRLKSLRSRASDTYDLCLTWRAHLHGCHCYGHRIQHICEMTGLPVPVSR